MRRYIEVLRNTEIARFIHRHKNWIITILFPIVLTAVIESQTGYFGDKLYDYFSKLEYKEGVVTPLLYYESMQYMDAQDYVEQVGKEVLDYGCILNVYLYNKRKSPMAVSETAIVIDKIKKIQQAKLRIIANYSTSDNLFTIYAINNGTKKFSEGKIGISAFYYDRTKETLGCSVDLEKESMRLLLGRDNIIEIKELNSGEIKKVASFNLNKDVIKDLEQIWFLCNIKEKNNIDITDNMVGIGTVAYVNSEIHFSYSEGTFSDNLIERSLIVDVDNIEGKKLYVPANIIIEENSCENILYTLYPTSSCEITFHAKIKCAGEKKEIVTEKFVQKIFVPLYKEENGFFESVRKFIEDYNIDTYYYNSNSFMQKEIDYVPVIYNQE